MHKTKNSLFWDGSSSSFSLDSRVKRVFEYGSFPELLQYPFEEIKQALTTIPLNLLRTSDARKEMLIYLKPFLLNTACWNAALASYLCGCIYANQKDTDGQ